MSIEAFVKIYLDGSIGSEIIIGCEPPNDIDKGNFKWSHFYWNSETKIGEKLWICSTKEINKLPSMAIDKSLKKLIKNYLSYVNLSRHLNDKPRVDVKSIKEQLKKEGKVIIDGITLHALHATIVEYSPPVKSIKIGEIFEICGDEIDFTERYMLLRKLRGAVKITLGRNDEIAEEFESKEPLTPHQTLEKMYEMLNSYGLVFHITPVE